jgi:hypothetical protein
VRPADYKAATSNDYLLAAITAALHGEPAPSLLPSGP